MKLTDENQDDMDCRPLRTNTGVTATSQAVEKRLAEIHLAKASTFEKLTSTDHGEHPLGAARATAEG